MVAIAIVLGMPGDHGETNMEIPESCVRLRG